MLVVPCSLETLAPWGRRIESLMRERERESSGTSLSIVLSRLEDGGTSWGTLMGLEDGGTSWGTLMGLYELAPLPATWAPFPASHEATG